MLKPLGQDRNLDDQSVEEVKEFIRKIVYNSAAEETYVQTRINIYRNMKCKSSLSLPPDPDSVREAIKRVHYQVFTWIHCCKVTIEDIPADENGWLWDEGQTIVLPVWFKGRQFPPSIIRKNTRRIKAHPDADAELSDEGEEPARKKIRKG
eukprot:gene14584-biopygen11679